MHKCTVRSYARVAKSLKGKVMIEFVHPDLFSFGMDRRKLGRGFQWRRVMLPWLARISTEALGTHEI